MNGFKQKIFARWAGWAVDNPWRALILVLGLTILFGMGYPLLKMEMTFYSMMPRSSSQVQDLKDIIENFAFSSQIAVIVDGRGIEDPDEAEKTIHEVMGRLEEEFLKPEYSEGIEGVTAGMDREFLRNHMMMLIKEEDQARFADLYRDLNLVPFFRQMNDDYEREYSGNEDNLEDDEAMVVAQFRGLERIFFQLEKSINGEEIDREELEDALDEYLFGESALLSRDNRMGGMFIRPTFNINNFEQYGSIQDWEDRAREIAAEYGVEAGLTGMLVVGRDEMATSEQGLGISMLIAMILVISLMIFSFRMKSVPFIVGLPLVLGILWAVGLTGIIIRRLNIVTAMYMVALVGLGVDYAIHLLAAYVQERADGCEFRTAVINSMKISGPGIMVGGLTTAAAFLALSFAETELISELGVVAGLGILCELGAMILAVPPLLALRQRGLVKKGRQDKLEGGKTRASVTGGLGRFVARRPGVTSIVLLAAGVLIATQAGKVGIEDNLMNLEAKGLTSIELQDTMVEEFGMAPDSLFIISDNLDEVSSLTEQLEDLESVKSVEAVSLWQPTEDEAAARRPLVRQFAMNIENLPDYVTPDSWEFLDEFFRLESNLIEMGDMAYLGQMDRLTNTLNRLTGLNDEGRKVGESIFDRISIGVESGGEEGLEVFQSAIRPLLAERLKAMSNSEDIRTHELPSMARDSYISKDGESYLINIVPRQNPWKGEFREVFTSQISSVTPRGTGMILVADQLNDMATRDGARATIISLIIVFLILLADFRNIKLSIMTFIPLIMAIVSLLGLMSLFNIKFDFLNIISIPLLIGIGIDYAIHINHRYRNEGPGQMERVIARTGTAILLTTITTVIGFASFIPSIMRAMRGTGIVLSLAMILTFIYSVLLHPALLILVKEKLKLSFDPWSRKNKKITGKGE